jgi:hypothetical protein
MKKNTNSQTLVVDTLELEMTYADLRQILTDAFEATLDPGQKAKYRLTQLSLDRQNHHPDSVVYSAYYTDKSGGRHPNAAPIPPAKQPPTGTNHPSHAHLARPNSVTTSYGNFPDHLVDFGGEWDDTGALFHPSVLQLYPYVTPCPDPRTTFYGVGYGDLIACDAAGQQIAVYYGTHWK